MCNLKYNKTKCTPTYDTTYNIWCTPLVEGSRVVERERVLMIVTNDF